MRKKERFYMKIYISGLQPNVDADRLSERLSYFGPVNKVTIVREGNPDKPVAIVDMDISASAATLVVRRINGIYFVDRFLEAHVIAQG